MQPEQAKNRRLANPWQISAAIDSGWRKNLETMYGGSLLRGWRLPSTDNGLIWTQYAAETLAPIAIQNALSGIRTPEIRQWRTNLVTNYEFHEGFLKGLRSGGKVRRQDKVGIGYPFIINADGNEVADIERPFSGPEEFHVDLALGYKRKSKTYGSTIDWSISLNVRNLMAEDALVPITANADGSFGTVRTPPSRAWGVTNTFRF